MAHYVGVLDGADDVWGVRIPDIPGCVGGGATPDAALADAIEALRDIVAHKRDGGYPVPPPSSLAAILASGEIGPGETAVRVPLLVASGDVARVNPSFEAARLDAVGRAKGS